MGYLAVETALKALQGEAVEKVVSVDTVIIDLANHAEFLK